MVIRRKGDYALENGGVTNDPKVIEFICDMKTTLWELWDKIEVLERNQQVCKYCRKNLFNETSMSEDSLKKQAGEKK